MENKSEHEHIGSSSDSVCDNAGGAQGFSVDRMKDSTPPQDHPVAVGQSTASDATSEAWAWLAYRFLIRGRPDGQMHFFQENQGKAKQDIPPAFQEFFRRKGPGGTQDSDRGSSLDSNREATDDSPARCDSKKGG